MKLADKTAMHFTFISSVERGERNVSLATLLVMAEGLEIDPSVLVKGLTWIPTPVEPSQEAPNPVG